ncbi:MAG: helix-turn-helix domain-containing protein [Butyrivibrio sp.]|nr:helix-turn-helix domain-containing protein [Butyrivibrio sp.]
MQLNIDIDTNGTAKERLQSYQLKAIREQTQMNRKEFAEWLGIPYRTISDWEHDQRKMPDYVMRLIAYKVKMEFVEKRGD